MICIKDESLCTGCTVCENICPKKAIKMVENKEGFQYPVIDESKCIKCGLCQKKCPVTNEKNHNSINECYAAYNKNKYELNTSTSGGIFSLLAEQILKDGGIVIGAAFDENQKLNHIAIDTIEDLEKLKGSKYLQSNLNDIFKSVQQNIKKRKVLFVGTPCQIAGLKSYVKEHDNLLCVDLVCHGVPSPKLFNKYKRELEREHNDKLINYIFRDKKTGWTTYSTFAKFKKTEKRELAKDNSYMKLFLSDIALRKSCYNCPYKLGNKYSDITLGDFWGISKKIPKMYNKNGVSAIILNTEKGKMAFNKISSQIISCECKLSDITDGNPALVNSAKINKNREDFFIEMNNYSISELTKKYIPKRNIFIRIIKKIKKMIG